MNYLKLFQILKITQTTSTSGMKSEPWSCELDLF